MARYLRIAAEANQEAKQLWKLIMENTALPDGSARPVFEETVAIHVARLVNYGIRCSPRAVQSTVRLNAIREAVKGLPITVSLEEVEDKISGFKYKALRVVGKHTMKTAEELADDPA